MNISENKRVVALSAVFALAFGGIAFYGYGESQKHAANEAEITQIRDRFAGYTSKERVPTKQNLDELKSAFSEVAAARADIQAEMNRYAEQCLGDGKKISAMDLQERLKASSNTVNKLASSNGVKLGRSASELGMEVQRKDGISDAKNVPYLEFQRRAVLRVSEVVLGAGVSSYSKVFCHALPEESADALDPSNLKAPAYFPLGFEVEFEAKRGAIPAIVNAIVSDKDYFLTITGMAVEGVDRLPKVDAYKAPANDEETGTDLGAEDAAPTAEKVATRKVGAPEETVRVYMTLEVLFFTPRMIK